MKNELKISILTIACVLFCAAATDAYSASSVRSLGGTGTYTSASSAANSGASTASLRGGSVRVGTTSSSSGSVAKPVGTTSTGSVVTTPRLSIGQYLGGGTSISGGSSLRPQTPGSGSSSGGGAIDPGITEGLQRDVDQLKRDVEGLNSRADSLEDGLGTKQETLLPTPDGYIVIDERTNEIFVDVENLKDAIGTVAGQDGREVEIGSNSTHLLWRYVGEPTWNELIPLEEIRGPQGEQGPQGEPGTPADMSAYSTTVEMNAAIQDAIDLASANYATKADLDSKVNVGDVYTKSETYTKSEVEQKIADAALEGEVDLTEYAKKTDLDLKADKTELANYATTDSVNTALGDKADKTTVEALSGRVDGVADDAAAAGVLAGQANVAAEAAKSEAEKANQALAGKADKSELAGYATTEALEAKADKSELTNLATKDELATKANAGDVYKKSETYSAATIDEKIAEAATGGEVDLSGYAQKAYVDEQLATKADKVSLDSKADKSELTSLATKEELAAKADASALGAYATTEAMNAALLNKADASALETKADKSELTNLATKEELADKADVSALGAYATTESMNEALANKADVSALNAKADKSELTNLATKDELGQKADASALVGKEDTSNKVVSAEFDGAVADDSKYPTVKAVADQLAKKQAAGDYALKSDLDAKADKTDLDNVVTEEDLGNYATKEELTGYASKSELEGKADAETVTTLESRVSANEAGISGLNTKVGSGELTTTSKEVIGAINELKTKTDGMATDGNFEEMNQKITQMEQKVDGAVSSIDGKAEKTYVDEQLATKANEAELGALAKKEQVKDADVAADAAISRTKLAADVQESLQKADSAISVEGAGSNKILGTDENGDEVWYSIAF